MSRSPGRPAKLAEPRLPPVRTARFEVGLHEVRLWVEGERWHVAVDGKAVPDWFPSQVEAWTAGVAEADRLDQDAK